MRLDITRKAGLATQALLVLGTAGDRMKAPQLAEVLGTTSGFVPQVLAPLIERTWITSEPGPTGGYQLNVDLDSVTVLDVIASVDGLTVIDRCAIESRPCHADNPCILHDLWDRARSSLIDELRHTVVSDLPAP